MVNFAKGSKIIRSLNLYLIFCIYEQFFRIIIIIIINKRN